MHEKNVISIIWTNGNTFGQVCGVAQPLYI